MSQNFNVLQVARVNAVMQGIVDVRTLPQELVWNKRIPDIPATDGEILARWTQRIQIADLIADDQKATTYSSGKLNYETYQIPNLKHGAVLGQEQLNQLDSLRGRIQNDESGYFTNTERTILAGLLTGVDQRKEALKLAMLLDGFSYNRLGIKMDGVTWGMPADLKVTLTGADTFDNPTTSDPVTIISTLLRLALVRYGIKFDRLSLSLTAFNYMIHTLAFQAAAKLYLPVTISPTILPFQNSDFMRPLAANILGVKEIEIYEARAWSQNEDGSEVQAPYHPINKILFTAIVNDGNAQVYDFADCIVTESMLSNTGVPGMNGALPSRVRGPVGYATVTPELNPPQITYWGVARGIPRKKKLQASAVLTVGTFTDLIPTTAPF